MEAFTALLAFCEGNPTEDCAHKGSVMHNFDVLSAISPEEAVH